jgi:hypothetical protein
MSCSTHSNFEVNKRWGFSIAVTHCPLTPFRHYVSATSKVLAIIDDGVQNRVMKNGETLVQKTQMMNAPSCVRVTIVIVIFTGCAFYRNLPLNVTFTYMALRW